MIKFSNNSRIWGFLKYSLAVVLAIGSTSVLAGYRGINSNEVNVSAGVTLNQNIQADRGARVYIQYGEVLESNDVNQTSPYCYFISHRGAADLGAPLDIQATTFSLVNIRNHGLQANAMPLNPPTTQYAMMGNGDGGSSNHLTLATIFNLNDPAQPQIRKLICGIWTALPDRGWLALDEIHQALGDVVSIDSN